VSKGSRKQAAGEVEAPAVASDPAVPPVDLDHPAVRAAVEEAEQRGREQAASDFEQYRAEVGARLEALEQQGRRFEARLNMRATLSADEILGVLEDDQRAEFVVAAPFRAGVVSLAAGQVVSNATHDLRQLARAGAPLNRAA
jgi:hypothetical protein